MSLQPVRAELAGVEVAGVAKSYDTYPAHAAATPALVVGLPRSIRPASHGFLAVEIPLEVVVAGGDKAAAEIKLLEVVAAVRTAYRGLQGTTFRSCRWVETSDFGTAQLGASEAFAATVLVELLVPPA